MSSRWCRWWRAPTSALRLRGCRSARRWSASPWRALPCPPAFTCWWIRRWSCRPGPSVISPSSVPSPTTSRARQALVVFANPRQAKRQCGRTQRVIKMPEQPGDPAHRHLSGGPGHHPAGVGGGAVRPSRRLIPPVSVPAGQQQGRGAAAADHPRRQGQPHQEAAGQGCAAADPQSQAADAPPGSGRRGRGSPAAAGPPPRLVSNRRRRSSMAEAEGRGAVRSPAWPIQWGGPHSGWSSRA